MKVGFVNIFGKPNAGKSTLLNALIGEKMAIVSPKVQTTRHRIKAILSESEYQIIFSDTPGIIEPKYKLHEKMMQAVKSGLEDADLAILLADVRDDVNELDQIFKALKLKMPALVVLNKTDLIKDPLLLQQKETFFTNQSYCKKVLTISALNSINLNELLTEILNNLSEGEPFYDSESLSDLPTRFFVSELIREKIYGLFQEELPYHSTVLVREYKEATGLVKISADIIVQRESQKAIIIGTKGSMIKKLGTMARMDIESFIGQKVFLELFVKVRPKWRDQDLYLKEYGYHG
jgi:GTP-binding protein Era